MNWKELLNTERPRRSTSKGDHRDQFERDYDRAIFSTPVKRLQDKAQVFPLEPNDSVRTRLTHSLEVSSVSRGLAMRAAKWLLVADQDFKPGMDRQIEAIAATAGLIHDLGNPPFGHSGEAAIQEWFHRQFSKDTTVCDALIKRVKDQGRVNDFFLFEGNAQTLRLISKLQVLADYHGLNLTFGTLSAACKYTASSTEADGSSKNHAHSKPGYFSSESELIERIRTETGTGTHRNPITFLVEAADDIVYSVADLEDGIKKGIMTWKEAEQILFDNGGRTIDGLIKDKNNILKAGARSLPSNLPDDRHASAFRTAAIGRFVEDCIEAFKRKYPLIMEGNFHGELIKESSSKDVVSCLKKELGAKRIYSTPSNLKLELMGRQIIQDLMSLFWEGAQSIDDVGEIQGRSFGAKLARLFSDNYLNVYRNSRQNNPSVPSDYHRLQLVTDYVCGMTDTFAKKLHSELKNG